MKFIVQNNYFFLEKKKDYFQRNINYKNYYDHYKKTDNIFDDINVKRNIKSSKNIIDDNYFNVYNYDDFYTDSDSEDDDSKNDYLDDNEYFELKTLEDKNQYGYMYDLPSYKNRLIVLDTEVSGKTEKDYIIEICAFEMINGKLIYKKKFHSFFKPKKFMNKRLIKRHKIPSKVFYYRLFDEKQLLLKFLDFIKDSLIISHNAKFDMEMINKSLKYYNLPLIDPYRFKCSMRIFLENYHSFSPKFSKLKECCKFLKIKYKKKRLHLASYDAYLTGKLMEKIFRRKKIIEAKNKKNLLSLNNAPLLENNSLKIISKKIEDDTNFKKGIYNKVDENLNNFEDKNKLNKIYDNKEKEFDEFIDKNIEDIVNDIQKEGVKGKIMNNNLENKGKDFEKYINENLENIIEEIKVKNQKDNLQSEIEDEIFKIISDDNDKKENSSNAIIDEIYKIINDDDKKENLPNEIIDEIYKIINDDDDKKENLKKDILDQIYKIISDEDKKESKIFLGKKIK